MALLDMCVSKGISCACAHVNYHHRPQAEEEEAYLRSWCRSHHVNCYVRNEPFEWKGNFEAAARNWRYEFFARVVSEHGFSGVLTAHHMDDLLETYFMQEEKGVIPETYGLASERMICGVYVLRPLLHYTKRELEEYCRQKHIRTFHDETNDDRSLTRNRIRQDIVSSMSDAERMLVLKEIERKNAQLQERRCRVRAWVKEEGLRFERYRKWNEEERLSALFDLLKDPSRPPSRSELKQIDHVLMTKNDFLLPVKDRLLSAPGGTIELLKKPQPYAYQADSEAALRQLSSPYFRVTDGTPGVSAVTLYPQDYPLTIRSPKDGDMIRMRFGRKAVHRFFIDRRIPRYERLLRPVVVNGEGRVILVPGLGCDTDHYSPCPTVSVAQTVSEQELR